MMKTSWLRFATVLGLSIGALALPATALAAAPVDPSIYRSSGQMAQGNFDIRDPSNPCLDTSGFVFGGNFNSATPGTPSTIETVGGIYIVTSDNCLGTASGVSYKGLLPSGAFQIDKGLTSASLNATVAGFDWDGNTVPVSVNIAWTGSGAVISGSYSKHFQAPGLNIVIHSSGDSRDALMNGSVTVSGTRLTLAGAPGSLQTTRSFDLFVCHSPSTGCK